MDRRHSLAKRVAGYNMSPSIMDYWRNRLDFDVQNLAHEIVRMYRIKWLCMLALPVLLVIGRIALFGFTKNIKVDQLCGMSIAAFTLCAFFLNRRSPVILPLLTFENWRDGVRGELYRSDSSDSWILEKSFARICEDARDHLIRIAARVLEKEAGTEDVSDKQKSVESIRSDFDSALEALQYLGLAHSDSELYYNKARELLSVEVRV